MRILYLADIRFPIERANGIQTVETCHALARRGHDVTLLARPDTRFPARDPLVFYGLDPIPTLRVKRVAVRGPGWLRRAQYLMAAMRRTLDQARIDVVFTRDLGVASLLARRNRRRRPPLVYESHGYAPTVSGLLPELLSTPSNLSAGKAKRLAAREQRVWRNAEGYVSITHALEAELIERLGARTAPTATIPDGTRVDPQRRFDWEGPADPACATYAGHLYPWKGVATFIEALSLLPGLHGRIVGGHPAEPDLERLRALARRRNLDTRLEFTGMVPPHEVARWLRASDVLVLPNRATVISARYTSPLKLFEYLGAGRAIVAANLRAIAEILKHEENALLVEPDDPQALASALQLVTSDRALAVRLARRAFNDAAGYSWERRAERLEALFDAVLQGTIVPR